MTVHQFRVRWYQEAFHKALVERKQDRLMAVWHRRAGKDEIILNAFRQLAFERPATYWHCFPEYAQARKAIWLGVNSNTGKRRIDEAFPPEICARRLDNEMFIEFKNGATWQLLGSDRYDATVGAGPAGIAYSEWALCNPSAWAYHSPMIRESKGFAAFITTPRGNNHAKRMADRAAKSSSWFYELLTVKDTGTLSDEVLAEALEEYQDLHGIDLGLAMFEQEYLCSWSGAMVGAYFGAEINRAEKQGRFQQFEIDWNKPVHTVWDLGKAVNNPIWCFQVDGDRPRIVDLYIPETDDLDDWLDWLADKGYHGNDYVPHDILTSEWGSGKTRFDLLQQKKRKPVRIPRVSVADGLQAGRKAINEAIFYQSDDPDDERSARVEHGIDGLRNYRREWDDELKTFRENPVKDWAEHIGSAWRYLGLSWRNAPKEQPKKSKPKELAYTVDENGVIQGNMSVREIVEERMRRRRMNG